VRFNAQHHTGHHILATRFAATTPGMIFKDFK